jgi:hypothetical protein
MPNQCKENYFMKKNRKYLIVFNLLLISILLVGISGCSSMAQTDLTPTQANSPLAPTQLPVTQTNLPPTQTSAPTITMTSTVQSDVTAYPTPRRDLTPTPNPTSAAWPEFSSEFIYKVDEVAFTGTLHYAFRYPSNWYLYPGVFKEVAPGRNGAVTYLQNYERLNNDSDYTPQSTGIAKLTIYALPCPSVLGTDCPIDAPVIASGYTGTQEMIYHDIDGRIIWRTFLFKNGFCFMIYGFMPGTPEENAELIQTLEDILATVRLW